MKRIFILVIFSLFSLTLGSLSSAETKKVPVKPAPVAKTPAKSAAVKPVSVKPAEPAKVQEKIYKIGDQGPGGGWVFYDKGKASDGWRYMEVAPEDQAADEEWGYPGEPIPGARGTAIGTGRRNTQIINANCVRPTVAAKQCMNYRGGGKRDWFLPSKDELNEMMRSTAWSKFNFSRANKSYWSSSEIDADTAWVMFWFRTNWMKNAKSEKNKMVRAIRAF